MNYSRAKMRNEEVESRSMSSGTLLNWPDLFLKKQRAAHQSARSCLLKSGKLIMNKWRESTFDPSEIENDILGGINLFSAAGVAGVRDLQCATIGSIGFAMFQGPFV